MPNKHYLQANVPMTMTSPGVMTTLYHAGTSSREMSTWNVDSEHDPETNVPSETLRVV